MREFPRRQEFILSRLAFPEVHVDQTKPCRIPDQFHGAVKAKLIHDIRSVIFNGLRDGKRGHPMGI